MSRLEILKSSLEKKEATFDSMLDAHIKDVKSANGQPLNDKRNGYSTMKRWDRQNDALSNQQKEIEKTKNAIENEEWKQKSIAKHKEAMPVEILELIENGTLKQWGKYPYIMFVDGVEKARIIWDDKKKVVMHKFANTLTDKEQRSKFAKVYNSLHASINQNK